MTRRNRTEEDAQTDVQPSTEALEVLVGGLFDYAGMFPPASLELDAALWESARSPRLQRPHMVGADLVVSADDLARLDEERLRIAGFADTEVKVAVVGVEADRLDAAVEAVEAANGAHAGVLRVVSLEAHGTTFPGAGLRAAAHRLAGVRIDIEPQMPDTAWARNAPGVLRLLEGMHASGVPVGLKLRGSGPTAVGPGTLAWLLPQVLGRGIPLKATAGLHHPLVEDRYTNAVGFLGLAAAIRLRQALGEGFSLANVQQCVTEGDPAAFAFDGELSWRGHAVTMGALRDAMRKQPFAIGSCSLREPDEDLARHFGKPRMSPRMPSQGMAATGAPV